MAWRHAVYIGDDHTDADAWRALHALRDAGDARDGDRGRGHEPRDAARMCVEAADAEVAGPPGVLELLTALRDRVAGPG